MSGGVVKSHRAHSPGRSFKTYTKADSTAQCLLILKSLLPNASTQQQSSEVSANTSNSWGLTNVLLPDVHGFSLQLELVKETIAYITYLESVLQRAPPADKVRVSVSHLLLVNVLGVHL